MGSYEKWHPFSEFEKEAIYDACQHTITSIQELEGSCTDWPAGLRQAISHLSTAATEMLEYAKTGLAPDANNRPLEDVIQELIGLTLEHGFSSPAAAVAPAYPILNDPGAVQEAILRKTDSADREPVDTSAQRPDQSQAGNAPKDGKRKKHQAKAPAQITTKSVKIYRKTIQNRNVSPQMFVPTHRDKRLIPDEIREQFSANDIICSPNLRISTK